MRPMHELATELEIAPEHLVPYGRDKAKVELDHLARPARGKLVLVSAITPTPAGEGKTTTSIGLADALRRRGRRVALALREPSLGPCFGLKGGGTGAGKSHLVPAAEINLHFTGDFHAITAAHNLLAALLDNHIHFRSLDLDVRRILWPRALDINDRALREVIVGLGGPGFGVPRQSAFIITAASELMAILCLAESHDDLRRRVDRILVGFANDGSPVTANRLGATGSLVVLLRDALKPNLVQTAEGTPAFVHGGPFANIAHGCNSVLATRMALASADWAVTEAGFGFDLGAEKFFDIKCVGAKLRPAAVVLVATVRALKMHGGVAAAALARPNASAVEAGLPNLEKHVENIRCFGEPPVVALNRFDTDSPEELEVVQKACVRLGVPFAAAEHFERGGAGAEALAEAVEAHAERSSGRFTPLYDWSAAVPEKILAVARNMYGAKSVTYTKRAKEQLADLVQLGYAGLPVCMAKTQSSLSDDPKRLGRPRDFDVTVSGLEFNAGAGFIVVITGDILRMPGLPKHPRAETIDLRGHDIVGVA